ncbi:EmrA/EmrK family multidrug efflux transporter periplasmic adaptor subunit, partial [Burkholderia sp. SIMBA_019]
MSNTPQSAAPQTPVPSADNNGKRRRLLVALTAAVVVAGLGYGLYWGVYARHFENTDDAYVAGNVVQ